MKIFSNKSDSEDTMNMGLFAADEVGYEIAKYMKENGVQLACLVLDSKDPKSLNKKTIANSKTKMLLYSDALYKRSTLSRLKAMQLDLIILAWWPYILKEALIKIPRIGCLNFHPSYLPYNRGKHPNFWSIAEDVPFGVSLHFVDTGIDSGSIAFQKIIPKSWEDTGKTLHEKGKREIVKLFQEKFQDIITGNIPRVKQDLTHGSFHKQAEIDHASRIDLDKKYSARYMLNLLRARTFPPYPAAWFLDNGEKYEIRVEIRRRD